MIPQVPTRRIFRIINGGTPTSDAENWDGDIAWATPVDVGMVHGRHLHETNRMLTTIGLASGSRSVSEGSLILSTRAPIGYVAIADRKMAFNQGCRGLQAALDVDVRYFCYQFEARVPELQALGAGSTFAELSTEALADFPLWMPSVARQRVIADFLDTETARIDALITKKQRLRDVLTERAEAAFDAATKSVDHRVPLKRVTDFREGPGILAEDFRDDGIPLLRVAGLRNGQMTARGCNYLDPEKVRQRWSHLRVRTGDLVISASASMGVAGYVTEEANGAVPYTGLIRFRPASPSVDLGFIRFFLESCDFVRQIDLMKTGTAIQHFGPTHLAQISIPYVEIEEQRRIVRQLEDLHGRVGALARSLDRQLELLREHRQALITAAVTGELEVPGVAA